MSEKSTVFSVFLSDAPPHDIGGVYPDTGAYKVTVLGVEVRKPHKGGGQEESAYLSVRLDSGAKQGMVTSLHVAPSIAGQKDGMLAARTAAIKAALVHFGVLSDVQARSLTGQKKLELKSLIGKSGHIWYEPPNPDAAEKSNEAFPFVRFISAERYTQIIEGTVRPKLRNVLKEKRETVSAGGGGDVVDLSADFGADGAGGNGAGAALMTPQPPGDADLDALLQG